MFGIDPFQLASLVPIGDQIVQPDVGTSDKMYIAAGALVDHYVLDAVAAAQCQRFVDDQLQRQTLAAACLLVGSQYCDGTDIDDPFL